MRFIDTFSGVGGFHIGIKRAIKDARCVASIEIDKSASKVYAENFGDVKQYSDITEVSPTDLPDHDMLVGGFPCQPFSVNRSSADKGRLDPNDNRGNLFMSLANICRAKMPKYFLFENVAKLVTTKNSDGEPMIDVITREMQSIGYSVSHKILNSNDFGVPQQRKRVFIAGSLSGKTPVFPVGNTSGLVVRDILQDWVDVDPKLLAKNKLKNSYLNMNKGKLKLDAFRECYKPMEGGKQPGKICPVSIIMNDTPSGISRQHDRLYSIDGISRTLATFGHPYFDVDGTWRLLTAREFARLQGFPERFVVDRNDNKAMKQFGNAVTVNVIDSVVGSIVSDDYSADTRAFHAEGF